jgi:RimJ/RimL family protein N-acetyltransferase
MTLIVRRLTASEGEAFRAVRLEALTVAADSFAMTLDDELKREPSFYGDHLKERPVWIALDDDTAVGMVGFNRMEAARQAHKGTLWGMYVAPSARGKGAADALIAAVLDHARAEGLRQVLLTCLASNPRAIAVYERHGFKRWGLEPGALHIGEAWLDDAHMVKLL